MATHQPMRDSQQFSDASWHVVQGEARSLRIGSGRRTLQVVEGPLWLTATGAAELPGEDYWLQPGEAVTLPSGAEIVVEGWPAASFQLLVPPQDCTAATRSISAWLSHRFATWRGAWQRRLPAFAH